MFYSVFYLNNPSRPHIRVRPEAIDWIIEALALICLVVMFILPVLSFSDLPDEIPTHFNAAGEPDAFSPAKSIWTLPVTGLITWILLTLAGFFPRIYNYPVQITPENAGAQYRTATRLMRTIKCIVVAMFAFMVHRTILTALGKAEGMGKVFLPVSMVILSGATIFYIVSALNQKHKNDPV
ncbi:MAG: DUF1648 domain-containing protein [Bacteroidales bacterium]|jgi:uncharacterized membrane protein|nr:DUF1648 domain-containing protein [Bacteroidales bacterium]